MCMGRVLEMLGRLLAHREQSCDRTQMITKTLLSIAIEACCANKVDCAKGLRQGSRLHDVFRH
jgi:hypothetical protein